MDMDFELWYMSNFWRVHLRWLRIGYLNLHMLLLCWLSLGDGFILGIFLGLGMVYEFDLLVRGLHP